MNMELLPVQREDLAEYMRDMQEAFQKGATDAFPDCNKQVLSAEEILASLAKKGAIGYKAMRNGKMLGGAIVVIDALTQRNHLDFLYVKQGVQSKGVGQAMWKAIEQLHPQTKIWETVTPYFEKRNIHFYVNRCGFHIVEFFNPHHRDPSIPEDMVGGDFFFRFEKRM
ncbi:MAG TPA: GNAT family N-acetyltransferase [Candidatus Pullichristensenella excrementigallinarum]|uniref:GNAT family N-acetyltransferase n=1 Tax=Candidatus Pullichristensenella excrementigallinarum TaxID=2840907 RepID=A0A9D1IBM7_9FIRM|nr:GNAT family N-acetyltransferase [Candidatus Pullichristensenella excrementigallinarum]